jgi:ketosteroid isomerase-like protein
MKRYCTILVAVVLMRIEGTVAQAHYSSALASLIETEKAFAAMSLKAGMKEAFLSYLAGDGILFRPSPVNGKQWWHERKQQSGTERLEWWPTFADVSWSGDVGYTSGPWIFTPDANLDQPPRYGYFVSIWKKQKDGRWRVALDIGTINEHPEKVDNTFSFPASHQITKSPKRVDMNAERRLILKLEKEFSIVMESYGLNAAFKKYLASDGRMYRQGNPPVIGLDAVSSALASSDAKMNSTADVCVVSRSGDLAYTYGKYQSTQTPDAGSGYFVRIWKKYSGNWKIVLDIVSPNANE